MHDHDYDFDETARVLDREEQEKLGRELRASLIDVDQTRKRLSWVGRLVVHRRFDDAVSLIDAASGALRHLRRAVLFLQSKPPSSRPPRSGAF